jgi:signal peptidase I
LGFSPNFELKGGKMENPKRRKPVVALLLSFLTPGLGQIYNGKLIKGVILYLFGFFLTAVLLFSGLFYNFIGMILCLVVLLLLFLFILLDAFRGDTKLKEITIKPYNKWFLYLIIFLINIFVIQPLAGSWIKNNIVRAFKIPSSSMKPTLLNGDRLIANMTIYKKEKPNRGDVVVFLYPKDRPQIYVKRIMAVEGDIIEIRNKQIFLNGLPSDDKYGIHVDNHIIPGSELPRDNLRSIKIPNGCVFLMGDNRDESFDSRFWGPINSKDIIGKAIYIYWSWDKEVFRVRLYRLGQRLQ